MGKKRLDTADLENELKGGSAFFNPKPAPQPKKEEAPAPTPLPEPVVMPTISPVQETNDDTVVSRHHDTKEPETKKIEEIAPIQRVAQKEDAMIPRHHDTTTSLMSPEMIEIIRKAVKHLGKEAATYRFTAEEKRGLSDIVYTYKTQNVKTSENEITRTAINFIIEDYRINGKASILARVLDRLNE